MLYVEVILPLPLDGLFTYSVPAEWEKSSSPGSGDSGAANEEGQSGQCRVQPFVRVKVPFGITKTHTALVVRVHDTPPASDIKVKDIIAVLDSQPVLLPEQYRLWQWISSYYMCPLGDILSAALPHGMKNEESYRPKLETFIKAPVTNLRTIQNNLQILTRSPKQLEVYTKYLEMTHLDTLEKEEDVILPDVSREELTNASHATSSVIKALIDKGILTLYDKEVGRLNYGGMPHPERIKPLSEAQQTAFNQLSITSSTIKNSPFGGGGTFLLHGVTGSGKTEIYIHLIQEAIDRGEQVMYLLPEIALTVQIMQRLQYVFGNRLGIYHSKYSDAERTEIWQKQLSDKPYDVILGARSAVFLPYQRLGLIIIDEEHETSFKQQDPAPRYHARSVAMMMAHFQMQDAKWNMEHGATQEKTQCKVVLGTATPSAESYYNALTGKYKLVKLSQKFVPQASSTAGNTLPESSASEQGKLAPQGQRVGFQVVDVKDLRRRKIMRGLLSPQLEDAVREALDNGEQAIIFHNRRGFSPIIECHQCGWSPKCPNCDVSLTYHKTTNALVCHYCNYTLGFRQLSTFNSPLSTCSCPDCGNPDLRDRGAGTEKVEDIIADTFPRARIARMDLDTTRTRNAYERIISEFSSGKSNLLIGTQMVTKGLDFDNVSVVGILSADTMLNQPDFRAHEHAFMMMTQVAGRAGRKGRRGMVILQTGHPELPVIKQIVNSDYEGFFRRLMQERKAFHYPPFTRLIYIYLKHKDENVVNTAGIELASRLRQSFNQLYQVSSTVKNSPLGVGGAVLGPDKPSVSRIKLLYIRKIVLKLENSLSISKTRQCILQTTSALMQDARYKSLLIYYDVDPL